MLPKAIFKDKLTNGLASELDPPTLVLQNLILNVLHSYKELQEIDYRPLSTGLTTVTDLTGTNTTSGTIRASTRSKHDCEYEEEMMEEEELQPQQQLPMKFHNLLFPLIMKFHNLLFLIGIPVFKAPANVQVDEKIKIHSATLGEEEISTILIGVVYFIQNITTCSY
jgi:hypothetical protein